MKIAILESLGITEEKLNELKEPFEKEGHTFVVYNRTNEMKSKMLMSQS